MTTASYDIGDQRRLTVTFTDINDTAADPTGVTFVMVAPDGTQTSYIYLTDSELVKEGVGVYYVDFAITQRGRHAYRFAGTGAVVAAEAGEFYARRVEVG